MYGLSEKAPNLFSVFRNFAATQPKHAVDNHVGHLFSTISYQLSYKLTCGGDVLGVSFVAHAASPSSIAAAACGIWRAVGCG